MSAGSPGAEYRILGPLEALVEGTPASLGGPRQRAVLALLLAEANETVPTERLIDRLWQEQPPDTAVKVGREDLDLDRFHSYLEEADASRRTGGLTGARRELNAALGLCEGH